MKKFLFVFLIAIIGGFAGSLLFNSVSDKFANEDISKEMLIKEFYEVENAVHVSPHSLRGKIGSGATDFVLVDLRSPEEYGKEHIISAINIPAYKDKDTSDYGAVDRIVAEFSKLPKDKDIIVYCYSEPCMTGRKIGLMLAEKGIYVKHLNIGWNEWRYFWNLWNHEHEWNATNVMDYVATGTAPGVFKSKVTETPCTSVASGLGC